MTVSATAWHKRHSLPPTWIKVRGGALWNVFMFWEFLMKRELVCATTCCSEAGSICEHIPSSRTLQLAGCSVRGTFGCYLNQSNLFTIGIASGLLVDLRNLPGDKLTVLRRWQWNTCATSITLSTPQHIVFFWHFLFEIPMSSLVAWMDDKPV